MAFIITYSCHCLIRVPSCIDQVSLKNKIGGFHRVIESGPDRINRVALKSNLQVLIGFVDQELVGYRLTTLKNEFRDSERAGSSGPGRVSISCR